MSAIFLIEYLIFGGAVLVWAAYEIWSVRRSKWNGGANEKNTLKSEESTRHTER